MLLSAAAHFTAAFSVLCALYAFRFFACGLPSALRFCLPFFPAAPQKSRFRFLTTAAVCATMRANQGVEGKSRDTDPSQRGDRGWKFPWEAVAFRSGAVRDERTVGRRYRRKSENQGGTVHCTLGVL